MFVGTQIFTGSLGQYFLEKQHDVTMEDNSYMCIWLIYKNTKGKITIFGFDKKSKVIFLVNILVRPVI